MKNYLNNLYDVEELSKDEEANLSGQIQAGDTAALNKLVTHNLRFVVSTVKAMPEWQYGDMPIEDLISIGNQWLLIAALRWKPVNGARFCTYAKKFITKGVRRDVNNTEKTIRLPVNIEQDIRKLTYLERKLSQTLNRDPSDFELAKEMATTEKRIGQLRGFMAREPISLDALNMDHVEERDDV